MPARTAEQGRIPHQRLQTPNPQRVRGHEFAQKLSQPAFLPSLANVTEQIAVSLRRDLRGESQQHTHPTSINVTTKQEDRIPTDLFGKKPGLPGSSERQEWEWRQKQAKERQAQQGSSGRGGGRSDRPVAGGQGEGSDEHQYWVEERKKHLEKIRDVMAEAQKLAIKGNMAAANAKMMEAGRLREKSEYYRQKVYETEPGGTKASAAQKMKEFEKWSNDTEDSILDRARELKERRDSPRGLRGKELDEWNKLKGILGDIIDGL